MRALRWLWGPYRAVAMALTAAMESILTLPRPAWASMGPLLLATLTAWFIYVPVHELLHAFGCLAAGGEVEELQISRLYGGAFLERVFPFVRAGGEYAGRLSKFDTGRSDLVYLATDLVPYLLTVVGALPLLEGSRRRRSTLLFGPGAVLAAAPLMGLVGDYFEMAGIVVSRSLAIVRPAACLGALRTDDLMLLLADFPRLFPEHRAAYGLATALTFILACLLVTATLAAAVQVGTWITRRPVSARSGGQGRGPDRTP